MSDMIWTVRSAKAVDAIKKGKRIDGRALDEYREIKIERDISKNAEGSCRLSLGGTQVVVGVKMVPGTPYPDSPNEGSMSVMTELLPMASPEYEFGPPNPEAIEVGRVVDRAIRESKTMNFEDFLITEGELAWIAFIDAYAINHDGNLFDAFQIASMQALMDTRIPKIEDGKVIPKEYAGKIKLSNKPVLCTTWKIEDKLFSDAKLEEERAAEARVSFGTIDNGDIVAIQKGEKGSFAEKELDQAIDLSIENAKKIRKLLKEK